MTINAKTGKKKIVPKVERIFDDSGSKVNPHLNPFIQLNDAVVSTANDKPIPDIKNASSKFETSAKMQNDKKEAKVNEAKVNETKENTRVQSQSKSSGVQ